MKLPDIESSVKFVCKLLKSDIENITVSTDGFGIACQDESSVTVCFGNYRQRLQTGEYTAEEILKIFASVTKQTGDFVKVAKAVYILVTAEKYDDKTILFSNERASSVADVTKKLDLFVVAVLQEKNIDISKHFAYTVVTGKCDAVPETEKGQRIYISDKNTEKIKEKLNPDYFVQFG